MKYKHFLLYCALLFSCVFARDCLLYQDVKNSLYTYIPEINKKIRNRENTYDVMPDNFYFKINTANDYQITYVIGKKMNFAFASNKQVEITVLCSFVIAD